MKAGTVMMEFPDGTSGPVPINRVAEAKTAGANVQRRPTSSFGRPRFGDVLGQRVADALPTVGAIGGSILGGIAGGAAGAVGGPPGAAVGGFAGRTAGGSAGGGIGQALREKFYESTGRGDAPGSVGGEMRAQAFLGPLGEGAGAALGAAGRGAIRMGLPARVQDAGRVIGEMVRERIPIGGPGLTSGSTMANVPIVGPMLSRGSKEAVRNFAEKAASREATNVAAEASGVLIPRQAAEDVLEGLINKAAAEMGDDAEVRYFQRVLDSWRRRKSPMLAPTEVQRIVTRFNARSKPVMKALKAGKNVPTAGLQKRAAQEIGIADAFSKELEDKVPGWREYTSKLATAIGTKDAVKEAENQAFRSLGSRLATGSALATGVDFLRGERDPAKYAVHGLMGAAGGAAMASPALMSRTGLLFNDPLLQMLLRQAPRAYTPQGE